MKNAHYILVFILTGATVLVHAQSKPWPVPQTTVNNKNPLAEDASASKNGKILYMASCAPCHGNGGKGDGIASAALSVKPANHTSSTIQAEPEGSLFYKISEGRNPMPAYKTVLTESQRWALVSYIKTLRKKS